MTQKLDDLFDVESAKAKELEEKKDLIVVDDTATTNSLQSVDEIDQAVLNLSDVMQHSRDMDDLAQSSMEAYEKILELADNVEEKNVGRILEAAVQMQRNALDAKNSKTRARQKAAEILLKKRQMDDKKDLEDAGIYEDEDDEDESSISGDRNRILDMLKNEE